MENYELSSKMRFISSNIVKSMIDLTNWLKKAIRVVFIASVICGMRIVYFAWQLLCVYSAKYRFSVSGGRFSLNRMLIFIRAVVSTPARMATINC